MNRIALALIGVLTASSQALAHEFWIQPSTHEVRSGELIRVHMMHGERFAGHPVPRNQRMIQRYEFVHANGESTKVLGQDQSTASFVRSDRPGVIVFESGWYENFLSAERFEEYLDEEKLYAISQDRVENGETEKDGSERYIRCAKAVLETNHALQENVWVGLPLEICALPDASKDTHGDSSQAGIRVSVRFQNQPIAGLRIVAVNQQASDDLMELITDEEGEAILETNRTGNWMLTTIHMRRATASAKYDWESFWASLTFLVRNDHHANE